MALFDHGCRALGQGQHLELCYMGSFNGKGDTRVHDEFTGGERRRGIRRFSSNNRAQLTRRHHTELKVIMDLANCGDSRGDCSNDHKRHYWGLLRIAQRVSMNACIIVCRLPARSICSDGKISKWPRL